MHALFLLLLLAQPVPPPAEVEAIQFPAIVIPAPPPAPAPMAVSKLTGQQLYVISSNIPCFVLDSPTGLVKITEEAGPVRVRGIFVDGNGKVETRTFKTKQVFIVEAVGMGTCELLVVTVGKTSAQDVIRKTLSVDSGEGPRPPPDPPTPVPPAPDVELTKLLQAAFSKDTDSDKLINAGKLASIYRSAAKVTATDSTYRTVADLDTAIRSTAQAQIGVLSIPNTRDAVGAWLKTQLPTAGVTVLDDALRQRYVAAWTALGASLDKVK